MQHSVIGHAGLQADLLLLELELLDDAALDDEDELDDDELEVGAEPPVPLPPVEPRHVNVWTSHIPEQQ